MADKLIALWGEQLLGFMEELSKETNYFPQSVLKSISKHFGFSRMLFFPYAWAELDIEKRSKRDALSNFVALNIDSRLMREYGEGVSKFDIFAPKNLSPSLKSQCVLFTEDIMPRNKYLNTEYYAYMSAHEMEKQACIYLHYKNEVIGNICIFRGVDDPDFTQQDRLLMEYLSRIVSNQYIMCLRLTGDSLSQEGFKLFFHNSKQGAIMLNSRLTVLVANTTAQEHCQSFIKHFGKEFGHISRSSYKRISQFETVQQIVDWICLDLINSDQGESCFTTLQEEFHFSYWPVFFVNIFGDLETRNLVVSTNTKKHLDEDFLGTVQELTQREKEILTHVLHGKNNHEIAASLHVSIHTVRSHVSNLYKKFGAKNRAMLFVKVNEMNAQMTES
jgi:DNA-binding CsgD family transcriptional regulator